MTYNKKAFSLFELILVLFISSIIIVYSFTLTKEILHTEYQNEKIAILKIDMNSTKIIIEKNLPHSKDKILYDGNTLYYDENILLKNVSFFQMKNFNDILEIHIILDNTISQTWKFKI